MTQKELSLGPLAGGTEARKIDRVGSGSLLNYTPTAHRRVAETDRAQAAARRRMRCRVLADELRRPTLTDIERMLEVLPYVRWVARDGRTVIFNRHYRPIWERLTDREIRRADSGEWVDWVDQAWFGLGSMRYEKSAREAYRKVLRNFFDGKPLIVKSEIQ
jgi:hypothetical protein